jgi:hypothetical protein
MSQCAATVHKPDTYRYTGRGVNGFERHYRRERCTRTATHGAYCWQHAAQQPVRESKGAQDQ